MVALYFAPTQHVYQLGPMPIHPYGDKFPRVDPTAFVADGAMLINAVIDLGTERNVGAVNRCSKAVNAALRNVYGVDMRILGVRALEEATRALAEEQTSSTAGFRKTAT